MARLSKRFRKIVKSPAAVLGITKSPVLAGLSLLGERKRRGGGTAEPSAPEPPKIVEEEVTETPDVSRRVASGRLEALGGISGSAQRARGAAIKRVIRRRADTGEVIT